MAPKANKAKKDQRASPSMLRTKPISPIQFPFQKLKGYAKGFKKNQVIGEGAFGKVYRAIIPSADKREPPTEVAIKVAENPKQTKLQLKMELKILESISHPNIIKLVGYSTDDKVHQCLVYEYMINKSLEDHIQDLNWQRSIQVFKDVASALRFLHQQNPEIIFRDLKPGNILLDKDFNAKLSDFGYAKQGNEGAETGGTEAYADPAQLDAKKTLTTKCDVFTFGMLMLEIITKQSKKVEDMELLGWIMKETAKDKSQKTVRKVVHADLKKKEDGYTEARAEKAIKLALHCVGESSKRPTMEELCKELESLI